MKKYFSFDMYNGEFNVHGTLEEAKKEAEEALDYYRDNANSEGWPDCLDEGIGYGATIGICKQKYEKTENDYDPEEWECVSNSGEFESIVDYELKDCDA